jgi:Tol biopolymer transport system component
MLKAKMFLVSLLILIFALLNTSCIHQRTNFGIVFSANLGGNQDVYSISSVDTESIERLTFTPLDREKAIKVTRDGSQILFYVPAPDISRITSESLTPPATYAHTYILNMRTKKIAEINDALGLYPAIPLSWSTNEDQVVLSEISSRKIYLVNPDKKSLQELKIPPFGVSELFELSYDPKGKQILYILVNKYATPSFTSFLYDLETKTTIQLKNAEANCLHSEWSPTGEQVLLLCDLSTDGISPNYHVYILDITRRSIISTKEVADFPQCNMPTWSPNGKQILMLCINNSHRGLFLVNSDGSNYGELKINNPSANLSHVWEIAWVPDGQKIVYIEGEDQDASNIYIVDIDGSNNFSITTQKANYSELSTFVSP